MIKKKPKVILLLKMLLHKRQMRHQKPRKVMMQEEMLRIECAPKPNYETAYYYL